MTAAPVEPVSEPLPVPVPVKRPRGRVPAPMPAPAPPPIQARPLDRHGLDASWDRQLGKGTVSPDFTLDLHGASLDAAHARLDHGLALAITQGARLVLVVTGRARPHDPADRGNRRGAIRAKFLDWLAAHPDEVQDGYALSKELVNAWTCQLAYELGTKGIRVNATMPSPTQTPMMAAFENVVSKEILNLFTIPSGRRSTPAEQGNPLILLNSDAASFISGVCLPVDGGFHGGVQVGAINMQALLADAAAGA